MPYCQYCGNELQENSLSCPKCGRQVPSGPGSQTGQASGTAQNQPIYPPVQPYYPAQYQPPKKKKGAKVVIAVVMIVIIVVLAIIILSLRGYTDPDQYRATIYIHVTSAHIANTIDIDIYADGYHIESDTLSALSSNTYRYNAWFSGTSDVVSITGFGQGGGLGDTTDSATLTVQDGLTYNVYLTL